MTRATSCLIILLLAMMIQPAYPADSSALSKGYLVVTFDDGRDGALSYAAPVLKQDHVKATMFVYEESIGQSWQGFLNLAGALKLQDSYGWQFEGHSLTHPDMNHLGSGQVAGEITSSQKDLQTDGFRPIASFAYPYDTGWENATVAKLVRQHYVSARRAANFGSIPVTYDRTRQLGPSGCGVCPPDRYQLYGNVVTNETSALTLTSYIDQAIINHTVLILVFHQIVATNAQQYEYLASDLNSVMNYASQKMQSGSLDTLYYSEAVQILFGVASFPAACLLICLNSVSGIVVAALAGVVWAFLLVRWNRKKNKGATPESVIPK